MHRVRAVADMYDVSVSTIYRAIEAGQLDALRIGTGKAGAIRIPDAALAAFEESCVVDPYEVDAAVIAADQAGEVA